MTSKLPYYSDTHMVADGVENNRIEYEEISESWTADDPDMSDWLKQYMN